MRILLALLLTAKLASADSPAFPPPPRLAITATELAALRDSPNFAAIKAQAEQAAKTLLKDPPAVPDGAGDWTFYYACPDDGSDLSPLSLSEHQCPKCKKIYSDPRTIAAWRTRLHDRANHAALQYAWAYAYSDDLTYAQAAQKIFLKLADDYNTYPKRRDRWNRTGFFARLGARRYCQSLDEAVAMCDLAKAYDLIRTAKCWTDEQRNHVENDFFRLTADTLLYANQDINNHQTWYNAGLMHIASVLADKAMVEKVLTMPGGYRDQLARSVDRDGLWYEGTMAYQNYALQAMVQIVDAGRRMNLPLHNEPKFKTLLTGPLRCAYPNGQFPAINDSDPMNLSSFDWSFKWAAKTYEDWPGKPTPPAETKSINLADAGLAVLRRGKSEAAVCVMLDYGPHGGGHGHFDKLNIVLYANGREWLLDPGRLSYSHKEYKTWVKETAAHNTVTLSGKSQAPTTGKLLFFDANENYTACAAQCDTAYDGATLTRYLLLTDDVLVDLFTVNTDKETQIDLLTHAQSEKLQPAANSGQPTPITPGQSNGYQHLTSAQSHPTTAQWDFTINKGPTLRLTIATQPAEQQITATGIGYNIDSKVPCLIRRVTAKTATFAAVYDLTGQGNLIKSIQSDNTRLILQTQTGPRTVTFTPTSAQMK